MMIIFALVACFGMSATLPIQEPSQTVMPNQNADVEFGDTIMLICTFEKPVNCGWSRGGFLLDFERRYTYATGNGSMTTECSMIIRQFQQIDHGEWKCEGLGDSEKPSTLGSSVNLSLKYVTRDLQKTTIPNTTPKMEITRVDKIVIAILSIIAVLLFLLVSLVAYFVIYNHSLRNKFLYNIENAPLNNDVS
jgi:hypothetical protein